MSSALQTNSIIVTGTSDFALCHLTCDVDFAHCTSHIGSKATLVPQSCKTPIGDDDDKATK